MKELNFKHIAEKLREVRQRKGLTQEYIANMADVNTSHISNIENCRVKISLQTLVAICNALDVTVDFILSNEYSQMDSVLDNEIMKELSECDYSTKEQILKIIRVIK